MLEIQMVHYNGYDYPIQVSRSWLFGRLYAHFGPLYCGQMSRLEGIRYRINKLMPLRIVNKIADYRTSFPVSLDSTGNTFVTWTEPVPTSLEPVS